MFTKGKHQGFDHHTYCAENINSSHAGIMNPILGCLCVLAGVFPVCFSIVKGQSYISLGMRSYDHEVLNEVLHIWSNDLKSDRVYSSKTHTSRPGSLSLKTPLAPAPAFSSPNKCSRSLRMKYPSDRSRPDSVCKFRQYRLRTTLTFQRHARKIFLL